MKITERKKLHCYIDIKIKMNYLTPAVFQLKDILKLQRYIMCKLSEG